jgi:hypothetical protein
VEVISDDNVLLNCNSERRQFTYEGSFEMWRFPTYRGVGGTSILFALWLTGSLAFNLHDDGVAHERFFECECEK